MSECEQKDTVSEISKKVSSLEVSIIESKHRQDNHGLALRKIGETVIEINDSQKELSASLVGTLDKKGLLSQVRDNSESIKEYEDAIKTTLKIKKDRVSTFKWRLYYSVCNFVLIGVICYFGTIIASKLGLTE